AFCLKHFHSTCNASALMNCLQILHASRIMAVPTNSSIVTNQRALDGLMALEIYLLAESKHTFSHDSNPTSADYRRLCQQLEREMVTELVRNARLDGFVSDVYHAMEHNDTIPSAFIQWIY